MAEAALIAEVLTRAAGTPVTVSGVTALSGGAASATWAVDAVRDGQAWPLILQCAAAGERGPETEGGMPKAVQARLQMLAFRHGLPVAEVVAVLEPGDHLGAGFIMARIDGESLAPKWLKLPHYAHARARLTGQMAATLARLHAIPMAEGAAIGLKGQSSAAQLATSFDHYRHFGVDSPTFDLAFAWLRERVADRPPRVIVHGDYRSGNIIVDENGLAAVLDWELAHLGDPIEDIGWLCASAWRFGVWQKPVGGFGDRQAFYDAYEAAGGVRVDPAEARVWEVWANLRWGLSCLQLGDDHVSGRVRSVERAAIGRRVTEVELDLLYILKHGDI